MQQEEIMEEGIMRYVFRTKSEKEALVDGYKWRKYGKKAVKSSPHRRYICMSDFPASDPFTATSYA